MAQSESQRSEAYKRGREIRSQLMGERMVEQMAKKVYDDPLMNKFGDYASEAVFGLLWSRPGLDLKTRTLICVVSDATAGRTPELAIHLRMARRQAAVFRSGRIRARLPGRPPNGMDGTTHVPPQPVAPPDP